jgi:hypothetical protein
MKTQKPIYFKVPISTYTTQKQLGKKKTSRICLYEQYNVPNGDSPTIWGL